MEFCAREAMQILGGIGYMRGSRVGASTGRCGSTPSVVARKRSCAISRRDKYGFDKNRTSNA